MLKNKHLSVLLLTMSWSFGGTSWSPSILERLQPNSRLQTMQTGGSTRQAPEPTNPTTHFKIVLVTNGKLEHAHQVDGARYSTPNGEYAYSLSVHFDSTSYAIEYEEKTLKTAEEIIEREGQDENEKTDRIERVVLRTHLSPQALNPDPRFHVIRRNGSNYLELKADKLDLAYALEKQLLGTPTKAK